MTILRPEGKEDILREMETGREGGREGEKEGRREERTYKECLKELQEAKFRFTRAHGKVRESRWREGGAGHMFERLVSHAKYFGLCPKGNRK